MKPQEFRAKGIEDGTAIFVVERGRRSEEIGGTLQHQMRLGIFESHNKDTYFYLMPGFYVKNSNPDRPIHTGKREIPYSQVIYVEKIKTRDEIAKLANN